MLVKTFATFTTWSTRPSPKRPAPGSYIIVTDPLAEQVVERINPADVAVCDLNELVNHHELSADKHPVHGGTCNYSGRDPTDIKAYILPRTLKVYPELRGVGIDFQWGGTIGIVPNRIPAVGRIDGNIFYGISS